MTLRTKNKLLILVAGGVLALCIGSPARASFVMSVTQVGPDVVGVGAGNINLTALVAYLPTNGGGLIWPTYPSGGSAIGLGSGIPQSVDSYTGIVGPTTFGSGGLSFASFGSGDVITIAPGAGGGYIFLPAGYVSGSSLSDTATWSSVTLAGLGLTEGIYVYSWGNGASADTLTLNIGANSVPEPNALSLLGLAGIGLFFTRLRKRRHSVGGTTACIGSCP